MQSKIRATKFYKNLTPKRAVFICEGLEEDVTPEQKLACWQYLVDSGMLAQLQGWFGRTAKNLISQGLIKAKK